MPENEELTRNDSYIEITVRDKEPIVLRDANQTCQFFYKPYFDWSLTRSVTPTMPVTTSVKLEIWMPRILPPDTQENLWLSENDIVRVKISNCPHTFPAGNYSHTFSRRTAYGDMIFENVKWEIDITNDFSVDTVGHSIIRMAGDMIDGIFSLQQDGSKVMFFPYDAEPENTQVISWADVFEKIKC